MIIKINQDIYLRGYKKTDLSSIYNYSKKKEFVKYMEYKPFTKKECKKWIKRKISDKNVKFYCIFYKSKLVGTYLITFMGEKKKICDLSYGIDPDFQGKGIFHLATKKILSKFNLRRFQIYTSSKHKKNLLALKKLNFKQEGYLKNYYFNLKTNKFFDGILLSKCK